MKLPKPETLARAYSGFFETTLNHYLAQVDRLRLEPNWEPDNFIRQNRLTRSLKTIAAVVQLGHAPKEV